MAGQAQQVASSYRQRDLRPSYTVHEAMWGQGEGQTAFPLTSILRWDGAIDQAASLRAAFEENIAKTVASEAFAEAIGPAVARALGALPAPRLKDVLRSPQFVAQIIRWRRHGIPLDAAFLGETLLSELVLEGMVSELPVSLWSARGDVKLVPEDGTVRHYRTPWLIPDRIAIDENSLQTFPYDGESEKLLLPLADSDAAVVRERLAVCMGRLTEAVLPA